MKKPPEGGVIKLCIRTLLTADLASVSHFCIYIKYVSRCYPPLPSNSENSNKARKVHVVLLNLWRVVGSKGGTEKVFCDMANALHNRGYDVTRCQYRQARLSARHRHTFHQRFQKAALFRPKDMDQNSHISFQPKRTP